MQLPVVARWQGMVAYGGVVACGGQWVTCGGQVARPYSYLWWSLPGLVARPGGQAWESVPKDVVGVRRLRVHQP